MFPLGRAIALATSHRDATPCRKFVPQSHGEIHLNADSRMQDFALDVRFMVGQIDADARRDRLDKQAA